MILTHRSGFALTDEDGHEVVHVLPCRLWIPGGAYGDVEALFRSVALDQRTIHVEQFTGGAEELQGRIRFHGDPDALRALLREGARGRTLTYYPDLAVPAEAYPVVLMDAGAVVQFGTDGARAAYGEWEVPVTLRRIDGGSLAPLASGLLVEIGPAGPMTGATFTRATTGTRISAARRIESIAAGLRRVTWIEVNGILRPFTLLEAARTQVAAFPQAPNSWTTQGTPVITTGITDPWGGTAAILVEDTDEAASEGKFKVTAVPFTGDGTKLAILAVRAGTMATIIVGLWKGSPTLARHTVRVTWNGGTTAPTLSTVEGGGTLYDPVGVYDQDGALWWLIAFSANGVVASQVNFIIAYGEAASTGTFYLAGGNAWDATYPASWQGPTLGTRNADQWSVPYAHGPMAASYAVRFVEQGMPPWVVAGGASPRIFQLGGAGEGQARLYLLKGLGTDTYQLGHNPVTGSTATATLDLNPAHGDLIELVAEVYADGAVQLHGRKNGGAVTSTAKSAAQPFAAAWAAATLRIGGQDASGPGDIGFGGLVARRGTGHDFDRLLARIPGGV
jgi:hypothetical protein